jgi:DNA-binding PadR family transcriptional regulator
MAYADPMSFRHFVLGLLTQRPMSGYDIKTMLGDLGWLIGGSSFGNIYPTLHSLHDAGLVSVEVVSNPDKPSKKLYRITPEGERSFAQWAQDLPEASDSLKPFVMSLMVAASVPRQELIACLEQRRDLVANEHLCLEETVRDRAEEPEQRTALEQQLVQDYGRAMALAELAWLEDSLDRLS